MPYGRGHGGEYVPYSLPLPITPSPRQAEKFFAATANTVATFSKISFASPKNVVRLTEVGGTHSFDYSFDGVNVHGTIAANGSEQFTYLHTNAVWLKNGTGAANVQVQAWAGGVS